MTLTCTVKVVPKSGKQKAILDKTGRLKIYLKSGTLNPMTNG